jgi:hypothetical protein
MTSWEYPVLPYGSADPDDPEARSSGWAGSDTSRERARRDDDSGATSKRQREVMAHLIRAGSHGLTWQELARAHEWHHGQASGALSALHKAGRIARLGPRHSRAGCSVYVAPEHVAGRETAPYGPLRRSLADVSDEALAAEITRRETGRDKE